MKSRARPLETARRSSGADIGQLAANESNDVPASPFLIWQILDSAFPTGGFAHSGGLEAAWQQGDVTPMDLRGFVESSLRQGTRNSLPFVVAAHAEPSRHAELDSHCDAFLTNHVANRASRLQGRAFWITVTRAFRPDLGTLPGHGHFAPLFGVVTRRLGLGAETSLRGFLFLHLRGLMSAAVRLNIVGPLEAQAIQKRLAPVAESLIARAGDLTLDDLAQTAPLLELWQGAHDRLYSRLFQS